MIAHVPVIFQQMFWQMFLMASFGQSKRIRVRVVIGFHISLRLGLGYGVRSRAKVRYLVVGENQNDCEALVVGACCRAISYVSQFLYLRVWI